MDFLEGWLCGGFTLCENATEDTGCYVHQCISTFFLVEKIDFVARVNHKDRMLTGGQIVRIDSQLQFIKNVEGGLYQLSYHRTNMTIADFVSRKKVEPEKVVPGVTKLWVENYQGYLEPKEAPSVDTANWIRWRNVWYRENGGKVSCYITSYFISSYTTYWTLQYSVVQCSAIQYSLPYVTSYPYPHNN